MLSIWKLDFVHGDSTLYHCCWNHCAHKKENLTRTHDCVWQIKTLLTLCSNYVTKNSFILNNLWTLNTTNIQIRKINVRIQLTTLWEHLNIIWYLLVWNIQHTFQKIFAWQLQFSSSVLCNILSLLSYSLLNLKIHIQVCITNESS